MNLRENDIRYAIDMYVSVRVRMKVRNQLNNPTDKSRTCYT